ncbi:MAG: poly-gamma-glutamate hydrolase family protein [Syntrophomonadaceae bacterium]|nr:poly-gamma-glutamate hydrolase family protein [Syntrophomonadaceae bacterium]
MKNKIISVIMTFLITVLSIGALASPASADTYSSYSSLKSHKTINKDYRIKSRDTASSTAVIAIHGGVIEFETDEIADAVASKGGYDFYAFEGLKSGSTLHITATKFDEPTARKLVAKSTKTLSVHGCTGTSQVTYVGGLDKTLAAKVKTALKAAGFNVATAPSRLAGTARANICNSNSIHKGVQLELTKAMRTKLSNNSSSFKLYTAALAKALK